MPEWQPGDQHYEKYGETEKEEEKQEKEQQEKSWDEKWHHDPLGAASWALILIWAGLVLLLGNLGFLTPLAPLGTRELLFTGAGGILLLQVIVRLAVPSYRQPVVGTIILAAVLIVIGLGGLVGTMTVGAVALIIAGLSILLRILFHQDQ